MSQIAYFTFIAHAEIVLHLNFRTMVHTKASDDKEFHQGGSRDCLRS